jgi:hypothetical protein
MRCGGCSDQGERSPREELSAGIGHGTSGGHCSGREEKSEHNAEAQRAREMVVKVVARSGIEEGFSLRSE